MIRSVAKIVVHCTDHDPRTGRQFASTAEVRDYHTAAVDDGGRGWADIGYHWVVERNGRLVMGRDEEKPGAHVRGRNHDTVGVALIGGFCGEDDFTEHQRHTLIAVLAELMERHKLTADDVVGHGELDRRKACPVLDMDVLRSDLLGADVWTCGALPLHRGAV